MEKGTPNPKNDSTINLATERQGDRGERGASEREEDRKRERERERNSPLSLSLSLRRVDGAPNRRGEGVDRSVGELCRSFYSP